MWHKYRAAGEKELGTRMLGRDKNNGAGQLGQKVWTGQQGQDNQRRQLGWYRQDKKEKTGWPDHAEGQGHWHRTTEMGKLRWDNCGRTAMIVKLVHDIWYMTLAMTLERTAQTGQPGQPRQVSLDRSAWTGQPGPDREDRMPVLDSQDQTVGTGDLAIRAIEKDSWGRT
jgi:hypothetical protein